MKYRVKGNLKHNGENYIPNVVIDLSEETAKPLLKDGVIEPIEEVKPVEVKKVKIKEEVTAKEGIKKPKGRKIK